MKNTDTIITLKKCKICDQDKELCEFPIDKIVKSTGLRRYRPKCKECYGLQRKQYFKTYYLTKIKK